MRTFATEIRRRLGPPPERRSWPLVSLVVLNRDGAAHLRRLLAGLVERTDYPRLELILVDNGSGDESLELMRTVEAPFPISIVANPHNESFSDACNQGASLAGGELLLFCNNDIEPFEPGWLRELVASLETLGAGAVSPTLITPVSAGDLAPEYRVQTRQFRLRGEDGDLLVDPGVGREGLFDEGFGEDLEAVLAIGACILISDEVFGRVGGFTHGYFYGTEDVDLFLKLRAAGLRFLYSGRSVAIHQSSATLVELTRHRSGLGESNDRLLWERWGPRIWREYELDRLGGRCLWAAAREDGSAGGPPRDSVPAPGFCLETRGLPAKEEVSLKALGAELERRGLRCMLSREGSGDAWRRLSYDVAVYPRGNVRHIPAPGQLNVLWVLGEDVSGIECRSYDLAVTPDAEQAERLRADSGPTPVIALNEEAPVADLVDSVLERIEEIEFPLRIEPAG